MPFKILCLSCLLVLCSKPLMAQNLPQNLTGMKPGVALGGPLLKGKTDAERWKFFQSQEQNLLGKSKKEVLAIFGKSDCTLNAEMWVYQITEFKKKDGKNSGEITELSINFYDNKVERYSVYLVHQHKSNN